MFHFFGAQTDRSAGAAALGLFFLVVAAGLAAALTALPPPSHPSLAGAGIALVAVCAVCLCAHGLGGSRAAAAVIAAMAIPAAWLATRDHPTDRGGWPLSIAASRESCALRVHGGIDEDFYRRLRDALDLHPRTRAIILSSAGGAAFSVSRSAGLLAERGVRTSVMIGQCDSACAFLWVAMPQRIIVGARQSPAPSFHAPHIAVPGLGLLRATLQQREQQDYLLRQTRLPAAFVAWAYVPLEGFWRPDARQLNALGIATRLIGARQLDTLSFCDPAGRT